MLFLYLFLVVIFINCAYLLLFLGFALSTDKNQKEPTPSLPISVLVYVKNNAKHLQDNLKAILEQNYPSFEVILINDASTDNSLEILEAIQKEYRHIPIHLSNVRGNEMFWGSKKYALTLGIKRATNEYLLFTDADCKPVTNLWIQEMSKGFYKDKKVVLGYSNYTKKKGFFNLFLRFDTLLNGIHYMSFANAKMTYMGVGRNLAYTSKVYYDNRGFISHVKMPVGDDDLLVNEIATKKNTSVVWNTNSHVEVKPLKDWETWRKLRQHRAWTFQRYKTKHKVILGIYFLSTVLFWFGAIASFFFLNWQLATSLIVIRISIQYISIGSLARKLHATKLIPFIPWLEFILIFLQINTAGYYIRKPANRNW